MQRWLTNRATQPRARVDEKKVGNPSDVKINKSQRRFLRRVLSKGEQGLIPSTSRRSDDCRHRLLRKGLLSCNFAAPAPYVWWVTVEGEEALARTP
jgi:hypothetical protein